MAANETINGIPTRILGQTGERVTIIGVGGFHIGTLSAGTGERIIRAALDEGINFLDNAWCYNEGESERVMGRALQEGYRDKAFLMTKSHGRDAATFRQQLEESLRRLQTDFIDLIQFHEINDPDVPRRIYDEGAIEAALEARETGKIRYIGFTGHRWPHLFRQMLDGGFEWDTVQMPVNLLDAHYRSFARELLPILRQRSIGVIGMKSLAGDRILQTGVTPREAISYSLSQPIDTLVTGIDSMQVLAQNLEIVRTWQPLSEREQAELLDRVSGAAADGHLEWYKTGD